MPWRLGILVGLAGALVLAQAAPAPAAAIRIACPAQLTAKARDETGILWQAPVSSWLGEVSLDRACESPVSQSITCTFAISGAIRTYVDGDCIVEGGGQATIDDTDDGGVVSTICRPANG